MVEKCGCYRNREVLCCFSFARERIPRGVLRLRLFCLLNSELIVDHRNFDFRRIKTLFVFYNKPTLRRQIRRFFPAARVRLPFSYDSESFLFSIFILIEILIFPVLKTPLRSPRPSEKLYEELIQEILCHLPLDSVFESKCVSPQWRDLINNPHFVMMHNNQSIQNQSFSFLSVKTSFRYISNFNRCKQVIEFDSLRLRSHVSSLKIVGSVNGLVYLENYSADIIEKDRIIFICNLVIGDWIKLPHLPTLTNGSCNFFGFGYCGGSCKYKVIRIGIDENTRNYSVDIITVGDESWRSIKSSTLIASKVVKTLMKSHREIECYGVFVDGYLHWVMPYKNQMDDGIRAFDIDTECFVMVMFPDFVQDNQVRSLLYTGLLFVGVLGGKLMLIDNSKTGEHQVWIMGKYGVKNSWFMQYVIPVKPGYRRLLQPLGVQENGKLLAFSESSDSFYSYDPETRKVVKLEVAGPRMFHGLILYMPSLVSVKNAIAPSNPSNHQ